MVQSRISKHLKHEKMYVPQKIFICPGSCLERHRFSDFSLQDHSIDTCCNKNSCSTHKTNIIATIKVKGALLLPRHLKWICIPLPHSIKVRALCDSKNVLPWLSQPPLKLKRFEANGTSEILDKMPRRFQDKVVSRKIQSVVPLWEYLSQNYLTLNSGGRDLIGTKKISNSIQDKSS